MEKEMTLEVTDQALQSLGAGPEPELASFPMEFVSKRSGAISRCLKEGNDKPFGLRSGEPCEINFAEPAFVATIEINTSRPAIGAGIELAAYDALLGRQVRQRWTEDAITRQIVFKVHCVTSGLSLYLPPGYFELKRGIRLQFIQPGKPHQNAYTRGRRARSQGSWSARFAR